MQAAGLRGCRHCRQFSKPVRKLGALLALGTRFSRFSPALQRRGQPHVPKRACRHSKARLMQGFSAYGCAANLCAPAGGYRLRRTPTCAHGQGSRGFDLQFRVIYLYYHDVDVRRGMPLRGAENTSAVKSSELRFTEQSFYAGSSFYSDLGGAALFRHPLGFTQREERQGLWLSAGQAFPRSGGRIGKIPAKKERGR